MRPLSSGLRIMLAATFVVAGCKKVPPASVGSESAAERAAESTAPPSRAVATPTPVAPRLAAAGIYFLLRQKSLVTDDGVIGFKPGTGLRHQGEDRYLAEGGRVLQLRADEVTNDLDLAARVAGVDAARQQTIRQQSAAAVVMATPARGSATPPRTNTSTAAAPMQPIAAPAAPPERNALGTSSSLGQSDLGSTHTMIRDGFIWQKDASGNWRRSKPLR